MNFTSFSLPDVLYMYIKCHRMILFKRHFSKKSVIILFAEKTFLRQQKTKNVKTLSNLNHSKTPKEKLKSEQKQ